ncbi:AraC family transcriptional regulator [Chitinivibrio alkaliphilus ACht1]|uniref:AraC family transcriptional regulator n=1 Tax=Chitinivibrio alkaliphilus ACht1 TaxID=1313304 RepID=U7D640_9BACT|nr:AraC family transcriptional regulator [Chitinivibrio alkaliphilus ACht1]
MPFVNTYLWGFITAPILLSLLGIFIIHTPQKYILPSYAGAVDTTLSTGTYSDLADGGNSLAIITDFDSTQLTWEFSLEESDHPDKYAGVYIAKPQERPEVHFDISDYTHVHLDAEIENERTLFFYVKTFIEDFTREGISATYAPFRKEIFTTDGKIRTTLDLDRFVVPDWWKSAQQIHGSLDMNRSQVFQFDFTNGNYNLTEAPVTVTIRQISFTKDISQAIQIIIIANIIYFVLFFLIQQGILARILRVSSSVGDDEKIIISYDKIEMKDEQEDDVRRITEQISKNYANADFNVEKLAREAGVSTSKIPALLKKKYSMNFKQYLNMVRITEAKRLLLETEHQIVSIAHSVGYNNIPHFNRTFKQYTGLSPKKYRENPEEATPIVERIKGK